MTLSLPLVLAEAAARHRHRAAVWHEQESVLYPDLVAAVDCLAGRLEELGLGGRRTGILLPNVPTFPLVMYGVLRAGGSALLLNPLNSSREVAEYLRDAAVDAVFTLDALTSLLPRGVTALLVEGLPRSLTTVRGHHRRTVELAGAPAPPAMPQGGDREAAVLYTSAERGWARGAVLTHRNLAANLVSTAEALQLTERDRVAAVLPLIHAFGLTVSLNATLAAGATMIPVERFNPLRVLELLPEAGITVFCGVPAMYIGLLAAVERRGVPEHSLRIALCGGAPLPVEVQDQWERAFGMPLRQGYGLTEAAPVCLFNRLDRPNHRGALGHPLPRVDVTIRDARGDLLPDGEVGEICVRGENVFPGYLGDRGRSPERFHGNVLRTGDLGTREGDGVIRFRGVLKPMFTRNGFNVYPRELERVLREDPRIQDASVAAQPDPARENEIALTVRVAPGAQLSEEDVRELCRDRLAAYKQPSKIELVGPAR